MGKPFGVVMFHCRHMFHRECLPSSGGAVRDFFTIDLTHGTVVFRLIFHSLWPFVVSWSAVL